MGVTVPTYLLKKGSDYYSSSSYCNKKLKVKSWVM